MQVEEIANKVQGGILKEKNKKGAYCKRVFRKCKVVYKCLAVWMSKEERESLLVS